MSIRRRKCKTDLYSFCFICGQFTLLSQRKSIADLVKKAFLAYFGVPLADQDKSWAPHKICNSCVTRLRKWTGGKRSLNFGVPVMWLEPTNHVDDRYFL